MKSLLKKLIPASVLDLYHRLLAWAAAVRFGHPANRMIVIGVTGTNGKSTVCNMIARVLEGGGHKVGMTTTANFKVAEREWLNDKKMTMLGRFQLQRLLRDMVDAGCKYAVIETSSEGIRQHRHSGINYDIAVFTNLTPEHIESHGGFENYKKAKGELFAKLSKDSRKKFDGAEVPKTIVVNAMDEHAPYFASFPADNKIGYVVPRGEDSNPKTEQEIDLLRVNKATSIGLNSTWEVDGQEFKLNMPGQFNIENAMAAIIVGQTLGMELQQMSNALERLSGVPGRLEKIDLGQEFMAIVDYAPEPESFSKLYEVVDRIEKRRVMHVLGSCGGGRDVSRRPVLGELAANKADIIIVTNEDPYDDDPKEIMNDVAEGARKRGFRDQENLFIIEDRGEAIDFAVSLASSNDLVLVTGKGCEQAIAVANGKKIPWDDRKRLRSAISAKLQK